MGVEAATEAVERSSSQAAAARAAVLEAEGARLVGILNAASARLVQVIAAAVAEGVWESDGIRSPQHWAALRFGLSPARAGRLVAAAQALEPLPSVRAAFSGGAIGEDHAAEIARAGVDACHDEEVAALATEATVTQLRRGLSFLPPSAPPPPADPQQGDDGGEQTTTGRRVGFGYGERGGWGLHAGDLDEAEGALVERALTAARDDLFRASHGEDDAVAVALAGEISWADALVRLAEAGLERLDPGAAAGRPPSERYLVNIHLRADHAEPWASIHLGPAIPSSLRQELTCDAQVRLWVTDNVGTVDLGRRQHVVDPRLRVVVEQRDGGCAVLACGARRHLVVHHIVHWEHGGPTDTSNLVALCRAHHRLVHQGKLRIGGNGDLGTLVFSDRAGRRLGSAPAAPPCDSDPHVAAAELGIPPAGWAPRGGERADWQWLSWSEAKSGAPAPRSSGPPSDAPPSPPSTGPPSAPMDQAERRSA